MTAAALSHRTVISSYPEPLVAPLPLGFDLDPGHEAHEPPEARGLNRDGVRLLVSPGLDEPVHTRFTALPEHLVAGDLLVVNNSPTVAAAIDVQIDGSGSAVVHVSTRLPGDLWLVEPRRRIANGSTSPLTLEPRPATVRRAGTGEPLLHLLRPSPGSVRLWLAIEADGVDLTTALRLHGRPIRYRYVPDDWPLDAYQTVFANVAGDHDPGHGGSAEMPSAARPFTPAIVTRLVSKGVGVVPITLHTGVSSLEGHERPYAEQFRVPQATAAAVNATHEHGGHVIAVGTTVVRSLETVTEATGVVHPGDGWTDVVITPERGVHAVDGLLTGWHEPEATHLAMLEAVARRDPLVVAYEAAFANGYLWHEFGDSHLILPYAGRR